MKLEKFSNLLTKYWLFESVYYIYFFSPHCLMYLHTWLAVLVLSITMWCHNCAKRCPGSAAPTLSYLVMNDAILKSEVCSISQYSIYKLSKLTYFLKIRHFLSAFFPQGFWPTPYRYAKYDLTKVLYHRSIAWLQPVLNFLYYCFVFQLLILLAIVFETQHKKSFIHITREICSVFPLIVMYSLL